MHMKKTIIVTLMLVACAVTSYAQRQNFMYPDKASKAFYDSVMYVNPKFYPGVVVSDNGKQSAGTMNICTVDQKIHFIGTDNDTLIIKNNQEVDRAYILGKAYINTKYGYIEMLEMAGDVALCELRLTEVHTDAATGAYGLKTQTSSVKSLTSVSESFADGAAPLMQLNINSDKPFSYSKKPYLLVKGNPYPVTKKALMKHFPKHKAFIEEYLKENDINFTSVAPVRELFKAVSAQ